jgi:peptidoglycan/LPS O-acetylase OafA/YrhL
VEEQFYLVLPLLVWFVSRKRLPYLFVGLILAAPLLRVVVINFYPGGGLAWYALMPCRADSLLLGAFAIRDERFLNLLRMRALYGVLAVLGAGVFAMAVLFPKKPEVLTFSPSWGYTWLALFYSCILLIAVTEKQGPITLLTRRRLFGKLAVMPFGMFLLHQPVRGILYGLLLEEKPHQMHTWSDLLITLIALLLTIALAYISWIFFEKRIVAWGRRSFRYENADEPRS